MSSPKVSSFSVASILNLNEEEEKMKEENLSSLKVIKSGEISQKFLNCPRGFMFPTDIGNQILSNAVEDSRKFQQTTIEIERIATDYEPTIELLQKELWEQFRQHQTEMIITKNGRRMFPVIKVRINGLNPNKYYMVYLDIASVDARRHRYAYPSSCWLAAGIGEKLDSSDPYIHPDSPALGRHWEETAVIAFDKLKLTNNRAGAKDGQIYLNSMQKYQPRVWVQEVNIFELSMEHQLLRDNVTNALKCGTSKNHSNFQKFTSHFENKHSTIHSLVNRSTSCKKVFPETSFITVTAYQNHQITRLKINSNPFAKGFRENSRTKEDSDGLEYIEYPDVTIPYQQPSFHLASSNVLFHPFILPPPPLLRPPLCTHPIEMLPLLNIPYAHHDSFRMSLSPAARFHPFIRRPAGIFPAYSRFSNSISLSLFNRHQHPRSLSNLSTQNITQLPPHSNIDHCFSFNSEFASPLQASSSRQEILDLRTSKNN